jgi:hypothetical protein
VLIALQNLVHAGTPEDRCLSFCILHKPSSYRSEYRQEAAQNFKEKGNDYLGGKQRRVTFGFYTQGVEAEPGDGRLREVLLQNRAACNLELRASLVLSCLSPSLYHGIYGTTAWYD